MSENSTEMKKNELIRVVQDITEVNNSTYLNDYLEFYIDYIKEDTKESSHSLYFGYVKSIQSFFEYVQIIELTRAHIQKFINFLCTEEVKEGEFRYSYSTISAKYNFLKRALALLFNLTEVKAFDTNVKIKRPKIKKKVEVFENIEILKIRDFCKNMNEEKQTEQIAIMIAIYTGARIGEVCALKWKDVNLEERLISFNKTIQRINFTEDNVRKSKVVVTSPKSSSSIRTVPIGDELFLFLSKLKNYENEDYVSRKINANHDQSFYSKGQTPLEVDSPLEPRTLRYKYQSILKKANVNYRNFHTLRHTFATRLISNGTNYKVASSILGHASISITLDTYTHISEHDRKNAVNNI